jgi:outer membrane protein OmpA-like peptidoglycan-associated protein
MKKYVTQLAFTALLLMLYNGSYAQLGNLKNKLKDKVNQRVNNKEDKAIDKTLDEAEGKNNTSSTNNNNNNSSNNSTNNSGANTNSSAPPDVKAYNNYDFVPGDKILFEDNLMNDQEGEFPAQWELASGQGVMNKTAGMNAILLTEGNYVKVAPRVKVSSYLTDPFTVEFDYYTNPGTFGIIAFFNCPEDKTCGVHFGQNGEVSTSYFPKDFSANYPADQGNGYMNKWHHVAIAFKNGQMKCYVDQYRVLVVPNSGIAPMSVNFGGIGDLKNPIVFTNVRVASGGGMNMIGKKFTDAKIVTHGINFDYNKATIKPESMGTLNMIVKIMQENPELKFEVGGHTDGDGDAAYNMNLSQQRANTVRDQLIAMGIDGSRLTAKGYGKTKPIADNNTAEGKANNRRVEFVKI